MNISRPEQWVLHALAQGGHILHERGTDSRRITEILCVTREGFILSDCTLPVFQRLRAKGLIASQNGAPYRITHLGRQSVRAQLDNR